MNIQSKLLIGFLSILFISYAGNFALSQETKSVQNEQQAVKANLLTHEQIISEAQRGVDRSLTILNYTVTAIGVLVGLLTLIVVVMGGIFGFLGFKTFGSLRKDIEKIEGVAGKSETKYEEIEETLSKVKPIVDKIARYEKDINGIKEKYENAFRNLSITEKPSEETKDKLDELTKKSEFLEGVGIELEAEDYLNRGLDYYYKDEYEKAKEAYEKAIELEPDDAVVWFNRGVILDDLGKYEEAIKSYDRAVELKPDYVTALNNKGVALYRLGKNDEAIKSYDKAIGLKLDYATAWDNKGIVLCKLGKNDEAIKHHDKAIELENEHINAWYNRACAYSLKGEKGKSLENLRKAIVLAPKSKDGAKKDEDFRNLWDDEDFKKIVE